MSSSHNTSFSRDEDMVVELALRAELPRRRACYGQIEQLAKELEMPR